MKISESQLRNKIKKIIKETLLLEREASLVRDGDAIYLVDDEGNEEFFADADEGPNYGLYEDGDSVPYGGGSSSYGRYRY